VAWSRTTASEFESAVADYGSVVLRPGASGTEPVSLYPERHVAVLAESDLVTDMPAAFDRLAQTVDDEREDGTGRGSSEAERG
jgi:L-lactate dehydrogenase complex protein LldG